MSADPNEYDIGELRKLADEDDGGNPDRHEDGDPPDGDREESPWYRRGADADVAGTDRSDAWASATPPARDADPVLASALFGTLGDRRADDADPVVDADPVADDPAVDAGYDATDLVVESGSDTPDPDPGFEPDDDGDSTFARLDSVDDPAALGDSVLTSDSDPGPATDPDPSGMERGPADAGSGDDGTGADGADDTGADDAGEDDTGTDDDGGVDWVALPGTDEGTE